MDKIISEKVLALREYFRKYREEHREKINENSRRWYQNNPKTHLERTNRWRDEHKEEVAETRKELYKNDSEKYKQKRREGYARNKEVEIERAKKYQREHPEETKERKRKWYEGNQDRNRDYSHNRRAKVRNVEGGHFTDKEFRKLCKATGNKCLSCGRTDMELTADHVIPLGPTHSDEISNIQPLCLSCNSRKGTKTVDYR